MEYYTWILTFHVVAFMSWMAMLFYLPRLFVYHVENIDKKEYVEIVKIQEFKIYKYIGAPAMWATILSGITMLTLNPVLLNFSVNPWMYAKLSALLLLIIYSFSLEKYRKELNHDICKKSGKFFRMYNEMPTMLAILIVGYVITKSFSLIFTSIIIILFAYISYVIMKPKKVK
ncbi:protoporphyrinogen oxidase HemJ [Arcobacter caeni]|jgi:protoporphyrinogen IX oxidase|uniref:Protoporphyrinogen IX oxidase n=1 Tax=Arcobacter caeni TaxID=1912877 RepID=A0A363D3D2_9BACT|nr:protoporphyrinogen oxidase HemJ [Arcobacter caeni]PUE65814.1 TIGR00701 family protein [Arcobacter caeni]